MGVLSGSEIRALVEAGEIFVDRPELEYRGAAVELRIAPDYMILPSGDRIWPGHPDSWKRLREGPIELLPGDVAFVSTLECITMPWNLAGNIAVRFRMEEKGLAVQGGLLVDPGYGMGTGGERLHFHLTNVSSEPVFIQAGEAIAALQLLEVAGSTPQGVVDKPPSTVKQVNDRFTVGAEGRLPQLSFFPEMRKAQEGLKQLTAQVEEQRRDLKRFEQANDRLMTLGVFVVAATLFTVAVAAIFSALAGGGAEDANRAAKRAAEDPPDLTVMVLTVGAIVFVAGLLFTGLVRLMRKDWSAKS